MPDEQYDENPKVTYAIAHALDLLKLLEEILSSDDTYLNPHYLFSMKGLTYKFFAHCTTILRLYQREEARISFAGKTYPDIASIRALVRVCVETYLTLFEVFFEHFNDNDTLEFRYRIWLLKGLAPGLLLQERLPLLLDTETIADYSSQVEERKRDNEECKRIIRESAYFCRLPVPQRKNIEKQLSNPKKYYLIEYADRSREQLLSDAGLNHHILMDIFSSTSSFIHSDGYSAWDVNPFNGYEGGDFEGYFLFVPIALTGKIITHFASLSEHYLKMCEQQPETFKLANNLSDEIKRGRSEDHAT